MSARARNELEVLDWIVSRRVHEFLDEAGRPIGEGRAEAFRDVQTEMQSCPYAGSRHHLAKPMNVTALRQMPPWRHVITMLGWLSHRYRIAHQGEVVTADDLAQVTSAGIFLADFLVLRRHKALRSGEIPKLISGLYKVCLGFQLAYLPERFADGIPTTLPDAAAFYDYLEASELLIGEAEVCSGSPAMIVQAYEAITARQAIAEVELPPSCGSLEIDWPQFDIFTHHASDIWLDLVRYAMRASRFCPELVDSRLPLEVQQRLNARLEDHARGLVRGQSGLVVDIALAAQLYADGSVPARWPQSLASRPSSKPSAFVATVLAWLSEVASEDMRRFAPVVAHVLEVQLAAYEDYEAEVLAGLDRHLDALMQTLGRGGANAALTPAALSRVCGHTLRDWDAAIP